MSAYFQKVRETACDDVCHAGSGQRNEELNKAAFSIGRHAHLKGADIDGAVQDLHTAAKSIGLHDIEIRATIGSGLKRGMENPRELPDNPDEPFQPSDMQRLIGRLARAKLIENDIEARGEKVQKAKEIWDRAVDISRDAIDAVRPALLYLNNRSIRAATASGVAKFTPNVYGGPALILPAYGDNGEISGVQAVLLTPEGEKREHNGIVKYSRGVIAGSHMTIDAKRPDAPIIMCEGPEDALSVAQAVKGDAQVICTFGKAGMQTFVPPRGADVTICADPDLNVERVAEALNHDGSIAVSVVRFDALDENTKDANDYIREHGEDKLREALAGATPFEQAQAEEAAAAMAEETWPTPYDMFDAEALPPRRWIYGDHYLRGFVSVLASAGGVGKTSMQIVEALAIVTGRPLLQEEVREQGNAWIVNLEDPLEELQRRVLAAMQHYNINPEDVKGKLFLDAGRDFQIKFTTQTRDGVVANDALIDHMIEKIKANDICFVSIDPWVGANDIQENDNGAMNEAVSKARLIADKTDCGICLVHHIRKSNGEEVTVDHIRGASALIGAARAARVINRVTEEEAMRLGVKPEEARGIFRVDNAKANLTLPALKATYRQMQTVTLGNGENVGACAPFAMPDLFDGVSTKDVMRVQQAVGRAAADGLPMRQSMQAKGWAGHQIGDLLGINTSSKSGKGRMSSMLKKWVENNVLQVETHSDGRQGRETPVYVVGEWITHEEAGY
jgi:RecA-family ATPase